MTTNPQAFAVLVEPALNVRNVREVIPMLIPGGGDPGTTIFAVAEIGTTQKTRVFLVRRGSHGPPSILLSVFPEDEPAPEASTL